MKGKTSLLAGVAVIALAAGTSGALAANDQSSMMVATAGTSSPPSADLAAAAAKRSHRHVAAKDAPVRIARNDDDGPSSTRAAVQEEKYEDLEKRVETLESEIQSDEERDNSDHSRLSALDQDFHDTQWSFDNARPTVKSGDGRFTMAFRVRFQSDFAGFMQDAVHAGVQKFGSPPGTIVPWDGVQDLSSGAVIRRAYFGVEGRAFKDFWYELRFNGGGSDGGSNGVTEGDPLVNKAVITYTGIPNFHVNVGVIEPNFMFEGTTSSAWLTFLERPEIDNIAADSFGAGDSRRGVEMNFQKTDALWAGDNLNMTFAYTGNKTGSNSGHGNHGDEQSSFLGRISQRLWSDGISNVQIGASGADTSYTGGKSGSVPANVLGFDFRDRPEIRVDGTRLIDTNSSVISGSPASTLANSHHGYMYALDAGANIESFFVGGEYAHFTADRPASGSHPEDHPSFSGWYLEASWFLTGETRQYSPSALNNEVGGWEGPSAIASPFSLDGDSWGAWELAARYSSTDLNWHKTVIQGGSGTPQSGIVGGQENVVDLAINWYLNKNIRLMLDDLITHVSKQDEPGILGHSNGGTGFVAPQSQTFNTVGIRLQFAN